MNRLLHGDCREVLPTLAADSVHCVVTSPPYYALRSYLDAAHPDKHREIGSKPTPDEYLATMVAVMREVRRVLRPDGTCWVNVGDSFSSGNSGQRMRDSNGGMDIGPGTWTQDAVRANPGRAATAGLAPKQLLLMPARLALALQADGWWVRSAIVWSKPNPMPESVSDRPTSAYEMVYLLTKSARYFYDAEAVREPSVSPEQEAHNQRYAKPYAAFDNRAGATGQPGNVNSIGKHARPGPGGRNLRNVWTIATAPYSDAHFATFPPALAERCIRAGTSERGCCSQCGKPWGRLTERVTDTHRPGGYTVKTYAGRGDADDLAAKGRVGDVTSITTGWQPGCACNAGVVPCTVLDPFAGAGTTLLVADRLQRDAIGIELNEHYRTMMRDRIIGEAPLFAEVAD